MLSGIIKTLMKHRLSSLRHATFTALSGIGQVLHQPRYAASALVGALGFAWLIFLLTNGGFYGALLMSRLPLIDKLGVIGTMFAEITRQAATSLTGALLVLVSILQGISLTLIIFTARHNKRNQQTTQQLGLSGIASVAAAIGLGCVPCGTFSPSWQYFSRERPPLRPRRLPAPLCLSLPLGSASFRSIDRARLPPST